jgi:hypothetical protein
MSSSRAYWLSILTIIIALLSNVYFVTALGLGLFVFALTDFLDKVGKGIPILEAMIFIACLQWILGPYIDYVSEYKHYKYHMYVPEEEYMNLVVPALFLFALPMYYITGTIDFAFFSRRIQQLKMTDRFAINMIIVGFLSDVLLRFAPASIGFIFFLASGIKFVGLLCLFYNKSKKKWLAFYILFAFQFLFALGTGVFHTLLLWIVFIFIFIAAFYQLSFTRKLFLISLGFAGMVVLQGIKAEFRNRSLSGNKTELFVTLFLTKVESYFTGKNENVLQLKEDQELDEANNRLNQGWIISRIMSQIPSKKPYLQGETIEEAISSSLVPRFFAESKVAGGGGSLVYEKLTGFHLLSTSMGTSVLGEAYGNYGVSGTYLFMFLWGLFLALLFNFIFYKAKAMPLLPLFLPIIFLQVIKAETDLFTVLNHLVKSTVFVFAVIYLGISVFKIRYLTDKEIPSPQSLNS